MREEWFGTISWKVRNGNTGLQASSGELQVCEAQGGNASGGGWAVARVHTRSAEETAGCTLGVRGRPRDAHSECRGDHGVHARSAGETAGCVQTVPSPSRAGAAQLQAGPATLTVTRFCYSPKEAKTDGSISRCSH